LRPRPKQRSVLYQSAGALWLVDFGGRNHRKLKTAPGKAGPAYWSGDGRTVLYLHYPEEKSRLNQLRENTPETEQDQLVAPTSQFVQFARNGDDSIFAGVSGSKGSPYLLLLHRVTKRELPIAEHRATDARKVMLSFSPNSQRLFYSTDREGKSAIYSIALERFVEKTDT
jgi:oligogalacturonide lyase